ncbi:uncharacterized protein G2W53_007372 [Senna tora]|uniref:Uncharacterized protein n=1 Tax=Senna tora TaxID=362788 RepID=A0A835CFL7_9FABA|nr:uncharacterized protein G2W53_007372 [Senna tora]
MYVMSTLRPENSVGSKIVWNRVYIGMPEEAKKTVMDMLGRVIACTMSLVVPYSVLELSSIGVQCHMGEGAVMR